MIILGIVLLIIGFVTPIHILWVAGGVVLVVGLVLWLLGSRGHQVGGRHHYY
jgi:membrane protein implicated in regulation of membrane protease activity